MDNPAQNIAQAKSDLAQVNTNLHKKKILVVLLILVIGLTAAVLGWYTYSRPKTPAPLISLGSSQPKQTKVLTKPKIIKEKSPLEQISGGHSNIYLVGLEYNPKTEIVIPKSANITTGEISPLQHLQPNASTDKIIYKVEVISEADVLIQQGWDSVYKEVSQLPNSENYHLIIKALYKPKATLRIWLPGNTLIWKGVMK